MRRARWAALAALWVAACGETAEENPLARAQAECAGGALEACRVVLESADADAPSRAAALTQRGWGKLADGDPSGAQGDFRAALDLDASNAHAVLGRATILAESGQLDAAMPFVERVIASGAYVAEAQTIKGRMAFARGDLDGAASAYEAALRADGRYAPAHAGRGLVKQVRGEHDGAIADFSAAIDHDPTLASAHAGRCWSRMRINGDLAAARRDADAAVAAAPRAIDGQLCLGLVALRTQDWERARLAYDAAVQLEPGNPMALFGRGVARRRAGDSAGTRDINQARDFDQHIREEFFDLGVRTY